MPKLTAEQLDALAATWRAYFAKRVEQAKRERAATTKKRPGRIATVDNRPEFVKRMDQLKEW